MRTPGPWHVETIVEDEGEPLIYGVCHPGTVCNATTVCNVFSEDDAHLIAAAPELFESLADLAELLVSTVTEFGCWTAENHPKVRSARAALAKARGEARGSTAS